MLYKARQVLKLTGTLLVVLASVQGCTSQNNESKPLIGQLEMTDQTIAFVQSYYSHMQRDETGTKNQTPLQISVRVGSSDDPDVCSNGQLYGPYTVTGNAVSGDATASTDQPTLRLANQGDLAICTIITSPVNATLSASLDNVQAQTKECTEAPHNLAGSWEGEYSCTSSCGNDSGWVFLTIEQDEYSATYTDGSADYEGTVCGNRFKFSGAGPGYTESGTFILNADGSGSKTSTYQYTDSSCGGSCSDPNLMRVSGRTASLLQ
jgi:hypothetical protein